MKNIFISYSWNNGVVADTLDSFFRGRGIELRRDIRDLNYRSSIKTFMKSVRKADYSLMIISQDYLKSANCMYEVIEFIKDEDYVNKILPLIHDETNIFTQSGKNQYFIYWQDKYDELNKELNLLDELNRIDTLTELKKIKEIQSKLSEFFNTISDMNAIVFRDNISIADFNKIYEVISPGEFDIARGYSEGYFMLNVPRTLKNHIMVWWGLENKGYTTDLKDARIFSHDEVTEKMMGVGSDKKFTAVPLELGVEFGQTIIPADYNFFEPIRRSSDVLGNKFVNLSEEEIAILI